MASLRTRRPRLDPEAFIAAAEETGAAPAAPDAAAPRPAAPAAAKRAARRKTGGGGGGGGGGGERGGEGRPWEAPAVRADVTKAFNLRLPEPLKLKLDFIRGRTRVSVHEFIMSAVAPAVDREIERLLGGKRK